MRPRRSASHPVQLAALLALAFGCARCTSDAGDAGAIAGAGSPPSAGASSAGSPASAGAPDHGDAGAGGSAGAAQAGAAMDSAGQGGSVDQPAEVIPEFNGCAAADDQDRSESAAERVIGIAVQGLSFTPKCLTIAVGQTVRWQGSLSSHPLAPGNSDQPDAGSADSPILETSTGQSVEFTFNAPGTFPYYCELHSYGDGQGMAGVVHVKP